MSTPCIALAAVLLVDRSGALLLQLRDSQAPTFPNTWGLPGGHIEPGETPVRAATRELWEETRLRADGELVLFEVQHLPEYGRTKHYFFGMTDALQEDVVVGEGAAIVFTSSDRLLDGRQYTPGTAEVLARFLESEIYQTM